ncbi:ATP-binding cassette domain-containing protein [Paenibacillus sp. SYP-B4298]|uniref:ATP-binding cassette domain-containing protein n=1 Tax=Paenibacillus sp. SYP-B4298 TaxID=2996034 RepID=UPI0022DE2AB1|nr:ABC transporter ATP-binding protein [Paenibacillus sp. SYP-B4298]
MTLLDIRQLSLSFSHYSGWFRRRTVESIHRLELSLGAGRLVAVVGSSGSGKSLLAHAIMGLLPRNASLAGEMLYKGEPLTPRRQEQLRGTSLMLVPQSVDYLDPLMRVGSQVTGARGGHKGEQLDRIFRRYGLEERVKRLYPHQLSGGMAKRVLTAAATLGEAELIIADEPTSGLGMQQAAAAVSRLRELADQGAGVLIITHDLEAVVDWADQIAVFYAGTIVELAPARRFAGDGSQLRHPYSRALWDALPRNGFNVLPGSQPLPGERASGGCPFQPRCLLAIPSCGGQLPPLQRDEEGWVRCIHAT